ncbi:MAG: hypothetical protein J6C09_04175, partial [Clostridia bacterium]|nr:hypothetical protein [Clostridia bacterium]
SSADFTRRGAVKGTKIYRRRAYVFDSATANESMVDMADAVLFVWDGRTQGIDKTLLYAKRKNKPYAFIIV